MESKTNWQRLANTTRVFENLSPTCAARTGDVLMYIAGTLNSRGFLGKNQNRIEESRVNYTEALTVYRQLAQVDSARYGGDVARVEASLKELDTIAPRK
jgi:NAD dependent epimerase/dehydratase family enzyme